MNIDGRSWKGLNHRRFFFFFVFVLSGLSEHIVFLHFFVISRKANVTSFINDYTNWNLPEEGVPCVIKTRVNIDFSGSYQPGPWSFCW